ncbi:palmitoyltransferase ZDHHC12-B-like [Aplochiton taeniatus]
MALIFVSCEEQVKCARVYACQSFLSTCLTFLDLRKYGESGEFVQPVVFSLLVLLSVLLYFTVALMDPGFVLTDNSQFPQVVCGELEDMVPRLRRCGYCLLQQPMRAKHCQKCKHCVRRFDHHCPWIKNCVGERNHRWFIMYLAVQLVVLVWALQLALSGISSSVTWKLWFCLNVFLLAALGIVSMVSVVVALLLCCHLYLISINSTTWEFMSHHRISYLKNYKENPFNRGVVCNLLDFFCICQSVAWEQVYYKVNHNCV